MGDILSFESIGYLRQALSLFGQKETDDPYYLQTINQTHTSLAAAYINVAKRMGRKEYADSCLQNIEELGDKDLENGNISNHISTRFIYVDYLLFGKKYQEALTELLSMEEYTTDGNFPINRKKDWHEKLYVTYKQLGKFREALYELEKYEEYKSATLNDSTFNKLKNAEVAHAQMIEEIKRENEKKLYEAKKNKLLIIVVSLFVGLSLIGILLYNKRKANIVLAEKNDTLDKQKTIIEEQNKSIVSSINYARYIQRAAINTIDEFHQLFPESFVYYKPRNIVCGDWYRVASCAGYRILAVADCTGHGVPGALLSMLGISALKDIIAEINQQGHVPYPSEILNRMREHIITSLAKSTTNEYSAYDGMDMTILVFTPDPTKALFATAKQDLILVRSGEVSRIKGDSMPVGRFIKMKDFSETKISLQDGDMLYLGSDGIRDQFGQKGKFNLRRLTAFAKEHYTDPVDKQLEIITQQIDEWQGSTDQTDDQTLIGVRVRIN